MYMAISKLIADAEAAAIIEQAKNDAAEIISKARDEASEIIEQAKNDAVELIEDAKDDAAELIEDAKDNAIEIIEQAKDDAILMIPLSPTLTMETSEELSLELCYLNLDDCEGIGINEVKIQNEIQMICTSCYNRYRNKRPRN